MISTKSNSQSSTAAEQCCSGEMAVRLPIAVSDKPFAKSRQRKFFWMLRNVRVCEQSRGRSNDFDPGKIFAQRDWRLTLTSCSRVLPSKEKRAAPRSTDASLYKSVTNSSCKPSTVSSRRDSLFENRSVCFSARSRLRGASGACGQEPPVAQKRDALLDRGGVPAP